MKMFKYTNEILENINNKYPVLHYYNYNFTNKNVFSNSILDRLNEILLVEIELYNAQLLKFNNMYETYFPYI